MNIDLTGFFGELPASGSPRAASEQPDGGFQSAVSQSIAETRARQAAEEAPAEAAVSAYSAVSNYSALEELYGYFGYGSGASNNSVFTPEEQAALATDIWGSLDISFGNNLVLMPKELQKKLSANPEMAQRIAENIQNFISSNSLTGKRSAIIVLDKNGNIAEYQITAPKSRRAEQAEADRRRIEQQRKAKLKRYKEYKRLLDESALKRRLTELENAKRAFNAKIRKKTLSPAYEAKLLARQISQSGFSGGKG